MAFQGAQVSVGITPTALFTYTNNSGSSTDPVPFMISVPVGTSIYVGGASVATGTGYLLQTATDYSFSMRSGEVLYAIAPTINQTVYVLQGRR